MQLLRSFLFDSSLKMSTPSASRLITPDGSNTPSPKQATIFFHAGRPGATTGEDREGLYESTVVMCGMPVRMHGTWAADWLRHGNGGESTCHSDVCTYGCVRCAMVTSSNYGVSERRYQSKLGSVDPFQTRFFINTTYSMI